MTAKIQIQMNNSPQPSAAGEAAHTFTLREVPALDESGATAHELEIHGHTVAHVYPDCGEEHATFIVRACNAYDANQARIREMENLLCRAITQLDPRSELTADIRAALALSKEGQQ